MFLLLFVLSLAPHVVVGGKAYNEERALAGQPPISIAAFLISAKFWSSTLQTWQAERWFSKQLKTWRRRIATIG